MPRRTADSLKDDAASLAEPSQKSRAARRGVAMPTGRDLLLAHGWMLKQSIRGHFHGKGRNWKRRYFVLTGAGPNGSELRYFENESCSPREDDSRRSLKVARLRRIDARATIKIDLGQPPSPQYSPWQSGASMKDRAARHIGF